MAPLPEPVSPQDSNVICEYCGAVFKINPSEYRFNPTQIMPLQKTESDLPRSKSSTVILAILLGIFGVHRFYTGKIMAGIFSVLLFGCLAFAIFVPFSRLVGLGSVLPLTIVILGLACILVFWWVADIVRIILGKYKDGQRRIIGEFR